MLPKRRFWNVENYVGNAFCKHFSSLLAQIEYLGVWKLLTKGLTHIFFDVPKSSFGSHNIAAVGNSSPFLTNLCSPSEDFVIPNERFGTYFQSTFQRCEYSILGDVSLKSASKTLSETFVQSYKIFVW